MNAERLRSLDEQYGQALGRFEAEATKLAEMHKIIIRRRNALKNVERTAFFQDRDTSLIRRELEAIRYRRLYLLLEEQGLGFCTDGLRHYPPTGAGNHESCWLSEAERLGIFPVEHLKYYHLKFSTSRRHYEEHLVSYEFIARLCPYDQEYDLDIPFRRYQPIGGEFSGDDIDAIVRRQVLGEAEPNGKKVPPFPIREVPEAVFEYFGIPKLPIIPNI